MIKISLVFDHRGRTQKGEAGPIEIRVMVNRKPYYINTGVRARRSRLFGNQLRDDRYSNDADVLNERLSAIVEQVERAVNKCIEEHRAIDVAEIKRNVWDLSTANDGDDTPTMINWIKGFISMTNLSKSTKKRYVTVCNRLLAYGKMVRWEQLTVENIYAWDAWMRAQPITLTENQ